MKDWVKLNSFERLYRAEIRKQILKDNGINALILSKRDSVFLFGEHEIYVEKHNVDKAKVLINEFSGSTMINSFSRKKQVEKLQEILSEYELDTELKTKEKFPYLIDNYELYIENEKAEQAKTIIKELKKWKCVETVTNNNQAENRIDILDKNNIDTILIKHINSDMHVDTLNIYAEEEQTETAKKLLLKMEGWEKLKSYKEAAEIYVDEKILEENGINIIYKDIYADEKQNFVLYVKQGNKEKAEEILNLNRKWKQLKTFTSKIEAEYYKDLIKIEGYEAVLVVKKDSSFLLGDLQIYVEEKHYNKIQQLLKEYENKEI